MLFPDYAKNVDGVVVAVDENAEDVEAIAVEVVW